jgi:hypothetical protein
VLATTCMALPQVGAGPVEGLFCSLDGVPTLSRYMVPTAGLWVVPTAWYRAAAADVLGHGPMDPRSQPGEIGRIDT